MIGSARWRSNRPCVTADMNTVRARAANGASGREPVLARVLRTSLIQGDGADLSA
jgi:hypothetical protein